MAGHAAGSRATARSGAATGLPLATHGGVADGATVPVSHGSLAAILRLAELGLAHGDRTVTADEREAFEHIRTILADSQQPGTGSDPTPTGETK